MADAAGLGLGRGRQIPCTCRKSLRGPVSCQPVRTHVVPNLAAAAAEQLSCAHRQQERLRADAEAQAAKIRTATGCLDTWQQCQRLWMSLGSLYTSQVRLEAICSRLLTAAGV